jgi:hypothetical protein
VIAPIVVAVNPEMRAKRSGLWRSAEERPDIISYANRVVARAITAVILGGA